MNDYHTFTFAGWNFDWETLTAKLSYALEGEKDTIEFTETLTFPTEGRLQCVDELILDQILDMLLLIGGISYYKTCCPKEMNILNGKGLTPKQATFWTTVYEKGLHEFFYRNDIDPEGLINFRAFNEDTPYTAPTNLEENKVLIPIGGGKDSLVTATILKETGLPCTLFRIGEHPLIDAASEELGMPIINVQRQLDPKLFELNKQGALNGHVPITAYLSTVTVLTAFLYGFDFIAMSNERSSSEGNVTWKGREVNHQWSKSLEFEQMFQDYVHQNVTPDIDYFSLLRGMSELSISQMFCSHPEHFPHATSCNANWRIVEEKPEERWCGECPKCAFAYCQFAAFLSREELIQIFPEHMFEKEDLLPIYRQLLGIEGFKPFECVGTTDETKAAFILAAAKDPGHEKTPVMQMFLTECAPDIEDPSQLIQDVLSLNDKTAVTPRFLSLLH